jgi:uncharacterized membrane protein
MESVGDATFLGRILKGIEYASVGVEVLAITIIVVGIVNATYTFVARRHTIGASIGVERDYRQSLGRTILLGLEVLVAADVVRTVALDPTIQSAAVLGILVVIRTFLSWALVLEIEGRWPWQPAPPTIKEQD